MKYLYLTFTCLLLSSCLPSVFDQPYPLEVVNLPADEAAHPAPIEWWYYTGHLADEAGNEYGFELTFFKAYAPPRIKLFGFLPAFWLVEKAHIAHVAITDINAQRFDKAERTDFGGFEGNASTENLDVSVHDWRAERIADGVHKITATVVDKKLELILTSTKPVALHGNPPGIQSMGSGGISYYLSYTRMKAEGTLKTNCNWLTCDEATVTGQAWHDHQWGDFSVSSYAGWDWFSVQFDNNTELMLYLIRQPSGVYSARAGSFVNASGQVIELSEDDFTLTETGETWTSEDTGAIYPMQWQIQVPSQKLDFTVTPVMLEQEMNTRASTGIVYWEGAVDITGSHLGKGYVELTNYDLYPYGQTDETTPLKPLNGPLGL